MNDRTDKRIPQKETKGHSMDEYPQDQPSWLGSDFSPKSYRSIFRWGDKNISKHPSLELMALIHERLNISSEELIKSKNIGLETVKVKQPIEFDKKIIVDFQEIVGEENIFLDDYSRVKASYGKAMIDVLRLREGTVENLPDLVLHPRNKIDIQNIINYCSKYLLPVYIISGGSSVTRGFEAVKGGVTIDLSTHLNKVISFNENNQSITVQPGIAGPELEEILNNAKTILSAKRNYTCGHFPQSFKHSTVGGWISARSAGQNSTYYGKIEDLVVSQEYITPMGTIKTNNWPRAAIGPDLNQIMTGSEGTFGILVEATIKIFRYMPENKSYFSFIFKSWDDAINASREIMQIEAGYPSVFRISDPEETDVAMYLYKIAHSLPDKLLRMLGFHPMERCLMLGYSDGEKKFSRNLARKIRKIGKDFGAFNLSNFGVTQKWEHGRFLDPYMRDDLGDYGIITDTLECAVTWDSLPKTYSIVRDVIKQYPDTICTTHLSHAYPQGGNLYFIFITKSRGVEEYLRMQYSILDAIQLSGAAISHHHGVGKHLAPWLPEQVGPEHMAVLKSLKDCFDPNNIMNPGGTLGLDLSPEQRNKEWGL